MSLTEKSKRFLTGNRKELPVKMITSRGSQKQIDSYRTKAKVRNFISQRPVSQDIYTTVYKKKKKVVKFIV